MESCSDFIIKERYRKKNNRIILKILGLKIKTGFLKNILRYHKKEQYKIFAFFNLKIAISVCWTVPSTSQQARHERRCLFTSSQSRSQSRSFNSINRSVWAVALVCSFNQLCVPMQAGLLGVPDFVIDLVLHSTLKVKNEKKCKLQKPLRVQTQIIKKFEPEPPNYKDWSKPSFSKTCSKRPFCSEIRQIKWSPEVLT